MNERLFRLFSRGLSLKWIAGLMAVAVLLFYRVPLFSTAASIQWDAAEYHYSTQKYFADMLRSGILPHWTPYVFSGMPFLADPQVGAWYPLHWPFFLIGITARSIQAEIALHCFIAALGSFFLAYDLFRSRWAGVFCAAFYALSGFFAGHSSHLGVFEAAALFPWLIWSGLRALRFTTWLPVVTLAAGVFVFVGHFQSALYAFSALSILLVTETLFLRLRFRKPMAVLVCVFLGAAAIPAVMTLPGLEFTAESQRATADYSKNSETTIVRAGLLTLVNPNHFHGSSLQTYTGPVDITQHYYYAGILFLPLILAAAVWSRHRRQAIVLLVPALWYGLGPRAGFYFMAAQLPGLRSVRAPVNIFFIVALGLALFATGGVIVLRRLRPSPWVPLVLFVAIFGDLWFWNMHRNRMAYAADSFENLYGQFERRFQTEATAAGAARPLARLYAASLDSVFGPLDDPLNLRIEATYGYNAVLLTRYSEYIGAAAANPRLLEALGVTTKLDVKQYRFSPNPTALSRLTVPLAVTAAKRGDCARLLPTLNPIEQACVEGIASIPQNGPAEVQIESYGGDSYKVHFAGLRSSLVRLAVPYFPGWFAEIDGKRTSVVPVDVGLMGVVVPAGNHEVVFRYRPTWFATGATISSLSMFAVLLWLYSAFRARGPNRALAENPL